MFFDARRNGPMDECTRIYKLTANNVICHKEASRSIDNNYPFTVQRGLLVNLIENIPNCHFDGILKIVII